jgi:hypothetical protein
VIFKRPDTSIQQWVGINESLVPFRVAVSAGFAGDNLRERATLLLQRHNYAAHFDQQVAN